MGHWLVATRITKNHQLDWPTNEPANLLSRQHPYIPITPTFTLALVGMFSTFIDSDDARRAPKDRVPKASALLEAARKHKIAETFIIVVSL